MASSTSLDSAVGDWRISFIFAVPDLNRSVKDDEASFNLSILGCVGNPRFCAWGCVIMDDVDY